MTTLWSPLTVSALTHPAAPLYLIHAPAPLHKRVSQHTAPASSALTIPLTAGDGPAALARYLVDALAALLPPPLIVQHAVALAALWANVAVPPHALPLMDQIKWEHPFRYHPKEYMTQVMVEIATVVAELLQQGHLPAPLTLTVIEIEQADDLSLHFLATLLRLGNCHARLLFEQEAMAERLLPHLRGIAWAGFAAPAAPLPDPTEVPHAPAPPAAPPANAGLARRRQLSQELAATRQAGELETRLALLAEAAAAYTIGGYYAFALRCIEEGFSLAATMPAPPAALGFKLLQHKLTAALCQRDADLVHETAGHLMALAIEEGDALHQGYARYGEAMRLLRLTRPPQPAQALAELDQLPASDHPSLQANAEQAHLFQAFTRNSRALAYFFQKRLDEAQAACLEAIAALEPVAHLPRAQIEKATFVYNISQLAFARKQYDEALRWLDQTLEIEPDLAFYYVERGTYLAAAGRYDEAIAAYDEALRRGVPTPELLISRAFAQMMAGRVEEALAGHALLRARFPERAEGFLDAAALLVEAERPDEAEAILQQALPWHEQDARLWGQRGRALQDLQRWEAAQAAYTRALTLDAGLIEGWVNQATLQYELGDPVAARISLERALALDPTHPVALENLAFLQSQGG